MRKSLVIIFIIGASFTVVLLLSEVSSSSRVFLEAVAPEIAILSVGKDNRYGHLNDETLVNLLEYGIQRQRTDKSGTLFIYLK